MLSYTQGFSSIVSGSGPREAHHELEKLLAKVGFLDMAVASCSTILGHEVLKG
jgi:hypothetical protein